MTLKDAEYQPPSDAELREKRLTYLRQCQPAELKRMRKAGEDLEAYLALSVKACREYAEGLMQSGTWEGQAWLSAIRQELLDSETD